MNTLGKIIIAVIVALAIGFGGYFLFQSLIAPSDQKNNPISSDAPTEVATSEAMKMLTEDSLFDFWTNPKTEEVFYMTSAGRISKITLEGATQPLTSQTIPSLNNINPTTDGSAAIIAFGYPQTPSFSVFNASKRNFQPLPQGATAADWKPQSNNTVVYLQNNGSSSRLSTLDLSTGKSTELLKINQKDISLEWIFPEVIYLYERPSDQVPSSLWAYEVKSKTIKKLAEESNLLVKWWPEKGLGLKWSDRKLSLINKAAQQISAGNLFTLPSKCFFDEPAIYCSAPNDHSNVSAKTIAARMQKRSSTENETIYRISSLDLSAGKNLSPTKVLDSAELGISFQASRIIKQSDRLLLLNDLDHKLYSLPL